MWSKFSSCFFFFKNLLLSAGRMRISKKNEENKKTQITLFWVNIWSNYVAQHAWTKSWLNLGSSLDSFFLTFWGPLFIDKKMLKPLFYSVFSKNLHFWSPPPPPKIRNTIYEHNCANWCFCCPFFLRFCYFGVFVVSGSFGRFLRGLKNQQNNQKGKKTTRCKQQNHSVLFSKREKPDNTDTK